MKKVLIFGGRGTASLIANNIIHANNLGYKEYEFAGFINDFESEIDGHPVIGKFSDVKQLLNEDYYFINTVYKIGGQDERIDLFEGFGIPDDRLCTFVHPHAYVAPSASIGPGSVVLDNASIGPMTKIGKCCLVLSNVFIGYGNKIGNYVSFTPQTTLGAHIKVEDGVWFGLNCTVRGKLNIGKNAAIGIGAVVTKNIDEEEVWVGNPARFHKTTSDEISM